MDCVSPRNAAHKECFYEVDILNEYDFLKAVNSFAPDYLIHMAARTDIDEQKDIEAYIVNTDGVRNVIRACNYCKKIKRVIFASSMLVCRYGYVPENEYDYSPNTIYGKSKVLTERIIRQSKISPAWLIIRPTSIWGPWFSTPYKDFFNIVLNRRFVVPSHMAGRATFGFVGNSVFQIDRLLHASIVDVQGKTFYIGDEPPLSIAAWADQIAYEAGLKKTVSLPYPIINAAAKVGDALALINVPFPLTSFRLRNITTHNILNISDTISITGKAPFSMQTAVQKTLKWMEDED
jgi:GlcNAc-P-P-Und epimerase